MDVLRFRDKFQRYTVSIRNQILTDSIAFLESTERPKCKPEHLSHLINFENELQQHLNQPRVPDAWFTSAMQTYGSFPFFEAFIRRSL
jgi:hypothetical protein